MKCSVCNIAIPDINSSFCPNCGNKMKTITNQFDGFISYRRSEDGVLAQWLKLMIEKIGDKTIFLDLDNINQGRFDDRILKVIKDTHNFILLLSNKSLDRCVNNDDWLSIEINQALKSKSNIIPIMIDDFVFPQKNELTEDLIEISKFNGIKYSLLHSEDVIRKILSFMVNNTEENNQNNNVEKPKINQLNKTNKVFNDDTDKIIIASTGLVVTDSFIYGSKIETFCKDEGVSVKYYAMDWSENILKKISNGKIDIGIYNEKETNNFILNNPNTNIRTTKSIGYSMGGKHFSIIVSVKSDLINTPHNELFEKLKNRNVYIGLNTDRFISFCHILGVSIEVMKSSNINFIDIPDPSSLNLLYADPSSILVGGQNIRFSVYNDSNFVEIINYDNVSDKSKIFLQQIASNCIVYSDNLKRKLFMNTDSFFDLLFHNFNMLNFDKESISNLIDNLEMACKLPENLDNHRGIIKHILYETYRIGEPFYLK